MANSADPDQMQYSATYDLGLHCLLRPVCPNSKGYYGYYYIGSNNNKRTGNVNQTYLFSLVSHLYALSLQQFPPGQPFPHGASCAWMRVSSGPPSLCPALGPHLYDDHHHKQEL